MYDLAASLALDGDTVTFHLGDSPVIYAQPFSVNAGNYVRVSSFRNLAERSLATSARLEMHGPKNLDVLLLTTPRPERNGNALLVALRNLDLAYLGQTLQWEKVVGGQADAIVTALAVPDTMSARFHARTRQMQLGEWKVDSVSLAGHVGQERIDTSFHTQADATLTIDAKPVLTAKAAKLDTLLAEVLIDGLPLPLANAFMPAGMPLSGSMSGHVTALSADESSPVRLNATLALDNASLYYRDADATIRFPGDTLRLVGNRLLLRDYNLTADNKQPLTLSGFVDMTRDVGNPSMSLRLSGKGVRLFRNTKRRSALQTIGGTLPVDADIRVAGVLSALRVTGSVSALSGTDLIYWMDDDPLSTSGRVENLAEFVRFEQLDRKPATVLYPIMASDASSVDVSLRLNVARNAQVRVNLPTGDDDHATIIGGGDLKFGSSSNGQLTLNGTYDANGGDVDFQLPMLPIAKSFALDAPSSIVFSGAVDQPELNLTASEKVRCTISDVASGTRAVTFVVYVYIRGTLDDLDISFSCSAPEDATMQSQIAALTDEERTRQAINLLVTQTYTGPGVSSNAGVATANAAINSLLQKEVESLLSQKLKHTDISVGIDTYGTTGAEGTRTDYNVKISQRLFDDRMRVSVGGRMSSGDDDGLGQRDNAVINDVSLEWLLKDDASQYLRLFRKTNYESVLEGEVVEMGAGYVVERKSFRLRDLLIPGSEKRRRQLFERIRALENATVDDATNPETDNKQPAAAADE